MRFDNDEIETMADDFFYNYSTIDDFDKELVEVENGKCKPVSFEKFEEVFEYYGDSNVIDSEDYPVFDTDKLTKEQREIIYQCYKDTIEYLYNKENKKQEFIKALSETATKLSKELDIGKNVCWKDLIKDIFDDYSYEF